MTTETAVPAMISEQNLRRALPACRNPSAWAEALSFVLPAYDIIGNTRVSQFIAQTAHESMYYNRLDENLNYSAEGLRKTWPRHFPTAEIAQLYARRPARIANRAYANRMGNGDEHSGDGWKFRGRGIIQLTGKNNYRDFSLHHFGNEKLLEEPDLLLQPTLAVASACWFWEINNINEIANDVRRTTRRINGGLNGLAHRSMLFERLRAELSHL